MSALVGFMLDMTVIASMSSPETAQLRMSVQAEEEKEKGFGRKAFFLAPPPTYNILQQQNS